MSAKSVSQALRECGTDDERFFEELGLKKEILEAIRKNAIEVPTEV